MLLPILTVLGLVILTLVIIAHLQKSDTATSRSITIDALSDAIFPHINNPRQFNVWNPWAKLDPESHETFDGPAEGVGAKMAWESKKIGSGSMTNVLSQPSMQIKYAMDFTKPFAAQATAEFTLTKIGTQQTEVTWTMFGTRGFMQKLLGLFMDCDKMVGDQFEKGLANLKILVESR